VKIGSVDVDIIGLTEITKLDFFKQQQNISRPRLRFAQSGWANKSSILHTVILNNNNKKQNKNNNATKYPTSRFH